MLSLIRYDNLPFIISIIVALVGLIFLILYINNAIKERKDAEKFNYILSSADSMAQAEREEFIDREEPKNDWARRLKAAGIVELDVPDEKISAGVRGALFGAYALMLFITKNIIVAVLGPVVLTLAIYVISNKKAREKEKLLNDQIPSFLHIFKSNLQAGATNEASLAKAIDDTADPLYNELATTREYLETGTMKDALAFLRVNTNNDSLRFLCSCIEISSEAGGNLKHQVEIIDELLTRKKDTERKIEEAEAENKPLIYVASSIIPLIFLYTYATLDEAKNYWFKEPTSYLWLFGIIAVITIVGLIAKRIVEDVRNL